MKSTSGANINNSSSTGTVTGSGSNTGAICGNNGGTVDSSRSHGSVSGAENTGGICGNNESGANIKNSSSTGTVTGSGSSTGAICGNNSGTVINSYYPDTSDKEGVGSGTAAGAVEKPEEAFKNGEVTYLLNENSSTEESNFRQEIGKDDYPVLRDEKENSGDGIVYKGYDSCTSGGYSNSSTGLKSTVDDFLVYTVDINDPAVLVETCTCHPDDEEYSATATISADNIKVDRDTGVSGSYGDAEVIYSEDWRGDKETSPAITYTDNDKIGIATAKVTINGKELTTEFSIKYENESLPDSSAIKVTDSSSSGNNGKISGVDDTMEYSKDGGVTWIPVPDDATELTGLEEGTYYIRYEETNDTFPSNHIVVTVNREGGGGGVVVPPVEPEPEKPTIELPVAPDFGTGNPGESGESTNVGMSKPAQIAAEAVINTMIEEISQSENVQTGSVEAAIKDASEAGDSITIKVIAEEREEESVSDDAEILQDHLAGITSGMISYADLQVQVYVNGRYAGNLEELSEKIEFQIQMPEDADGEYGVARVHNGQPEVIPQEDISFDSETKILTFYADRFSTYAVYEINNNPLENITVKIKDVLTNYGKIRVKFEPISVEGVKYEIAYRETDLGADAAFNKIITDKTNVLIENLRKNVKYTVKVRPVITDSEGNITVAGQYSKLSWAITNPSGEYQLSKATISELLRNTDALRIKTDLSYVAGNVKVQVKYKKTSEPSSEYKYVNGGDNIRIENLQPNTQYTVKIRYYIKDIKGERVFGEYSVLWHESTLKK